MGRTKMKTTTMISSWRKIETRDVASTTNIGASIPPRTRLLEIFEEVEEVLDHPEEISTIKIRETETIIEIGIIAISVAMMTDRKDRSAEAISETIIEVHRETLSNRLDVISIVTDRLEIVTIVLGHLDVETTKSATLDETTITTIPAATTTVHRLGEVATTGTTTVRPPGSVVITTINLPIRRVETTIIVVDISMIENLTAAAEAREREEIMLAREAEVEELLHFLQEARVEEKTNRFVRSRRRKRLMILTRCPRFGKTKRPTLRR